MISAAETVHLLGPIGLKLPATESQARPLTLLRSPDEQIEVWQRVVQDAGDRQITAAMVEQTIRDMKTEAAARRVPEPEPEPAEESVWEDDSPDETVAQPEYAPESIATNGTAAYQVEPENPESPEELEMVVAVVPEVRPTVADLYMVGEWKALSDAHRRWIVQNAPVGKDTKFNRTNGNVEWALWTWNPVTGCDHGCDYCYARDIADRFYTELPEGQRFAPVFRPSRLHAARHMRVPAAYRPTDPLTIGEKNVFVCSMADLFGKWVPQEWIDAVFQEVVTAADWNFLFLTKFPQRLASQEWPSNAWVGTTVDRQARVATAERSFRDVKAGVKWLSCEPMLERLTFSSLEMFDWVVIGGSSKSTQTPEFQPPWEWIEHLHKQARDAGCNIYYKPNLANRPREYPAYARKNQLAGVR